MMKNMITSMTNLKIIVSKNMIVNRMNLRNLLNIQRVNNQMIIEELTEGITQNLVKIGRRVIIRNIASRGSLKLI